MKNKTNNETLLIKLKELDTKLDNQSITHLEKIEYRKVFQSVKEYEKLEENQ